MDSIPPDLVDISPSDLEKLFEGLPTLGTGDQIYDVFNDCWMTTPSPDPNDHANQSEHNSMDDTNQTGKWAPKSSRDVGTLSSPTRSQPTLGHTNVKRKQKHLDQALGIGHKKPGPRPGEKKGKIFKKDLKAARGSPLKMAGVRKKHRHLFEGNCRRAMEQRIQVVFEQLLAAPDPAAAAMDPLIDLDVQFARRYYGVDLLALATPPLP